VARERVQITYEREEGGWMREEEGVSIESIRL